MKTVFKCSLNQVPVHIYIKKFLWTEPKLIDPFFQSIARES